jgi:hypothetical protein
MFSADSRRTRNLTILAAIQRRLLPGTDGKPGFWNEKTRITE